MRPPSQGLSRGTVWAKHITFDRRALLWWGHEKWVHLPTVICRASNHGNKWPNGQRFRRSGANRWLSKKKNLRRAIFFLCYPKMCGGLQVTSDHAACHHYYFNFYGVLKRMESWAGLASSRQLLQDQFSLGASWMTGGRISVRMATAYMTSPVLFCGASWEGAVDATVCSACVLSMAFTQGICQCLEMFLRTGYWHILGSRARISRHPMMWPLEHQRITLPKCAQCQRGDTSSLDCMVYCISPRHCQGWNRGSAIEWEG